jgi:mannose-6-phosphate isomerase
MQAFPEILRGVPVQPHVRRYTPPFDEFEVDCCLVPPGELVVISPVPGPSMFLVMMGEGELQVDCLSAGEKAKDGDVFFVPAYTEVKLSTCGTESMQLYRAGVNSRFFS